MKIPVAPSTPRASDASWFARYFSGNKLLQIGPTQLEKLFSDPGPLKFSAEIDASTMKSTGSILSTGPVEGVGYGAGAGGAVTQATSKTTTVTLNTVCGQITMNPAALASGAAAYFNLSNTNIATTDVLLVVIGGGATSQAYQVWVDRVQANAAIIAVKNISAGSLSEAVVLNFAVIKAVNS